MTFSDVALLEQETSRAVLVQATNGTNQQQFILGLNNTKDGEITPFLPRAHTTTPMLWPR